MKMSIAHRMTINLSFDLDTDVLNGIGVEQNDTLICKEID